MGSKNEKKNYILNGDKFKKILENDGFVFLFLQLIINSRRFLFI